nr:class I SAM-dependent methyltransferase [Modestobacter sp. DSM 44400]
MAAVEGSAVLDLGCGHGAWLLEMLTQYPSATGTGVVDISLPADVTASAVRGGLGDRIRWEKADARTWTGGTFDVVMCVGASHAFGGLDGTLEGVRRHLRPGGQVLLGDTIWEVPPSQRAQEVLGAGPDDFPDLAGLLDRARQQGFEPGYGHVSTLEEWNDYEWSWTGSLTAWALQEATSDEDRQQALAVAREHREGWIRGYHGQLGLVTVVLHDVRRWPT